MTKGSTSWKVEAWNRTIEKEENRKGGDGPTAMGDEETKRTRRSSISEARLCVNVWLAFGRQP